MAKAKLKDSVAWKDLKSIISEVVDNNDFGTEAGTREENGDCEIYRLFKKLEEEF